MQRFFLAMVATILSSARAFSRSAVFRQSTRLAFSSKSPMPYEDDKMPFYALGTNLALQIGGQGNFKTILEENEMDVVLEAFCDNIRGTATADAREVLTTYGPQLNKILEERSSRITERVKKEGEEFVKNFMDCNEEAIETDSGLVYCEMKAGEGKQPTLQSNVEVHYHGSLTDGTVFDSSVDRGQTISFPLSRVIKGWQEGLQLMREGGKATLVIPGDLAYGDAGSGEGACDGSDGSCVLVFVVFESQSGFPGSAVTASQS
jgi:FKBP-type peptidyl-prolyl cis-trans isomerase